MSTFKDRLIAEKEELDEKLQKLNSFIVGDNFKTVEPIQASLLKVQCEIMASYSQVLKERLDNL